MRPSEALAKHREEVLEIISRYPVTNLRIFGSTARGEDTEASDLDILVDRSGSMSFADLFGLEDEIGALLSGPVEVFTGLKPHAQRSAAQDLRAI
jgi:uncharacterized protein